MRVAWKSEAPRVTVVLRQLIDSDRLCGAADQRVRQYFEELGAGDEVALPAVLAWMKKARLWEAASILGRMGARARGWAGVAGAGPG